MSSYQSKDFKVGDPIDKNVAKHVTQLQKVFGDQSLRSQYIEIQSALPWIKMQSGAVLDSSAAAEYGAKAGNDLAKKNILFGLNTRTELTSEDSSENSLEYTPDGGILPGYDQTDKLGIRPKPGITGLNIRSHNRFGSLRTASISFQCWSKEQMDKMEVLYMRPGMTVLLEWGHSKYLTKEDKVVPSDYGIDYFTASNEMPKVISAIDTKRKESNFSYDGIVGIIKNFSWKFRADGGYDCQVQLVTAGDLIESYKASFYVKQSEIAAEYQEEVQNYQQNQASGSNNGNQITFPDTTLDFATSTDDPLVQIPSLNDIYSEFTGTVETALSSLPDTFTKYLESLTAAEKKTLFASAGFDTGNKGVDTIQSRVVELLGSLRLVKFGTKIGELEKHQQRVGTGFYDKKGVVDITVKTKWDNGLVNFSRSNNDLATGEIKEGNVAILPLDGAYTTTSAFLKGIREYQKDNDREAIECINAFFTMIATVKLTSGNNQTKLFELDNNTVFNSGSNPENFKKAHQYRFYNVPHSQRDDSPYSNFYQLEDDSGAFNTNGKPIPFLYKVIPDPSILFSGTTSQYSEASAIGPAIFFNLVFVGYEAILNSQGSSSQVVNVANAQGSVDDSFIDPNDDNLSKLHYYLRSKFDNPYVNQYLKESLIGKNFTEVFKYRFVPDLVELTNNAYEPSGKMKEVFGEPNGTQRTANLQMYDNEPYFNTYKKQLLSWSYLLGGRFTSANNVPVRNTVYVKLGALLELVNRHVLQSDSGYFFLFKSMYQKEDNTPLYRTQDDHLSVDPEICILPTSISKLNISRSSDTFTTHNNAPIILNIELSINFILDTLNKYIDSSGQVTILTFIQEVLDEVSRVCGGINNLQLQYREDSSLFHVVDRNAVTPTPKSKYPELNIFGLNSIIRDINMVSKITPRLSSMIAISAQDTAYTSTQDATGFGALNRGITDRIFADRYDEDRKEKDSLTDYDEVRNQLIEDVVDLRTHILTYYLTRTIPRIGKDTQPGVYQNYCNYLAGADSVYNHKGTPTYNFIIPFTVGIGTYGISGLQVMDAFRLDKEVLPKTYGGRADSNIAFLITGIEHTIDNGKWSTNLSTQIFNVEDSTGVELYPKTSFDIDRMPPNFNVSSEPRVDIASIPWSGSYTLAELTVTNTGLDNRPVESVLPALLKLDQDLLVPITNQFGKMTISSAYRHPSVNTRIGGSPTSQHPFGEAVDFTAVPNGTLKEVFKWIAVDSNLQFGQLIWEKGNDANPEWIHVSLGTKKEIKRYLGNNVYKLCDENGIIL